MANQTGGQARPESAPDEPGPIHNRWHLAGIDLSTVLEHSPDGFGLMNLASSEYEYMNPVLRGLCDRAADSRLPMTLAMIGTWVHPDDRAEFIRRHQPGPEAGRSTDKQVLRWLLPNGAYRWSSARQVLVRDSQNHPIALVEIIQDISREKATEQALRTSVAQFSLLAENITDVIWVINLTQNKVSYVSPSIQTLTGYTVAEIMDFGIELLLIPGSVAAFWSKQIQTVDHNPPEPESVQESQEMQIRLKNGSLLWIDTTMKYNQNEAGETIIIGVSRNIDKRKQAELVAQHLSYYDQLTGLPNRFIFKNQLEYELTQAEKLSQKLAVIALDLDRFKDINDTYGHQVGDLLLIQVANLLSSIVEPKDFISRYGGDQYFFIITDISGEADAAAFADKILALFRRSLNVGSQAVNIQVSLGIVIFPADGQTADSLIMHADIALISAKTRSGGKYAFFTPLMSQTISKRVSTEASLFGSIQADEFIVYYQPIVDIATARITSVEAVVRWLKPGFEMVSPLEFIPIAEQTDMIIPLTRMVLLAACRQLRQWHAQGLNHLTLSVNISPKLVRKARLQPLIEGILAETAINPASLILEVTESTVIAEQVGHLNILQQLRELGLKIAIDDFGTGFSSLSRLNSLPVDLIKLDKSFIENINQNASRLKIVVAILAMAKAMNYEVIVEGVETAEQLTQLQGLGCRKFQGYLFSKPVDSQAMTELLTSGALPASN